MDGGRGVGVGVGPLLLGDGKFGTGWGLVRVWDVPTWARRDGFFRHQNKITALAFSKGSGVSGTVPTPFCPSAEMMALTSRAFLRSNATAHVT
jgi:hypothetical protein